LALFVTLIHLAPRSAAADERLLYCRHKGNEAEKRGAWLEACRWYDEALRKERTHPGTRAAYVRCLRRLQILCRHRDPSYADALARLTPTQGYEIYKQLLGVVASAYVDRHRTSPATLFQQGLQELRFALEEDAFRHRYLADIPPDALAAFKGRLASWGARRITTATDACDQLMAVVSAAQKEGVVNRQGLVPVFCLEFAAGACNTLDEYSGLIPPGHMGLVQVALRGKQVGVGLELASYEDRVQVSRVYPKGPAAEAGLIREDRIVRIDRMMVEEMDAEAVTERLRGEAGSVIEVEFIRLSDPLRPRHTVKLTRRAVALPSVEFELMELPGGIPIGYLSINHFQDSTLQEVKEALASWNVTSPGGGIIKGLILDLRGNPGGLFKPAVQVAELFLTEGVIVVGQSPLKDYNKPFRVEAAGPVQMPLVVLIDGETASAAEVLAGALKEGRAGRVPTRLLGWPTYGKGSIQCLIGMDRPPLDKLPGGVRLTVARLFSPTNQPYTGRGVEPHDLVQPGTDPVAEARRQLQAILRPAGINMLSGDMPPT
jgi:carboxyl-terminal processing protease